MRMRMGHSMAIGLALVTVFGSLLPPILGLGIESMSRATDDELRLSVQGWTVVCQSSQKPQDIVLAQGH